MKKHYFS